MTGLQKLCALVTNRSGKVGDESKATIASSSTIESAPGNKVSRALAWQAQKAAAEAYVKERGGEIIGEYQEVETGKDCKRPEIMKAILHANRSWATLVIAKLDRLARNVWLTSTLMESGIDFVACDNPTASRLTIHILAAVAEEEARLISERTKAALAAHKARGGLLGPTRSGIGCPGNQNKNSPANLPRFGMPKLLPPLTKRSCQPSYCFAGRDGRSKQSPTNSIAKTIEREQESLGTNRRSNAL